MSYGTNIHEGEYVSIPSRLALPITCRSETELALEDGDSGGDSGGDTGGNGGNGVNGKKDSGSTQKLPSLVHKWSHTHSILCVLPAPSKSVIFCGTQDSKVLVFDVVDYSLKYEINCGHKSESASVLCLTMDKSERFLFSAGSDSLVKVWDLSQMDENPEHIGCSHVVYSLVDIGDIFSILWSDSLSTLFIGAQNASILWCKLHLHSSSDSESHSTLHRLPNFRYDKFFDSKGPGGAINHLQSKHELLRSSSMNSPTERLRSQLMEIRNEDIVRFAHHGYVYCMEWLDTPMNSPVALEDSSSVGSEPSEQRLISAGGDGLVIIWKITSTSDGISIAKLKELNNEESVLSMSVQDTCLYVGLSDPCINVWDLSTFQLVRSIHFKKSQQLTDSYDEVLSLGIYNHCIFKASNLGGLYKFTLGLADTGAHISDDAQESEGINSTIYVDDNDEDNTSRWSKSTSPNEGGVLAVRIFTSKSGITYLVSGGHKSLCLWDISKIGEKSSEVPADKRLMQSSDNDALLESLKEFISYQTVLKFPSLYLDDLRRCSQFLSQLLKSLGASETELFPVKNGNPVVYSCFKQNKVTLSPAKRVLWYAHYDVVDAVRDRKTWATNPFTLTARDGNLYARGVSDNKGPTLAAIYAVSDLHRRKDLACDVVFIIEGEEECGSIGFQDVITENKEVIGDIDWIMLSNSYWLDDETPCLNYGLRGVINASVTIKSDKPDSHSGVDGGVLKEPTMDLIQLLSQLVDPITNTALIPQFYDDVLPLSENEIALYQKIEDAFNEKKKRNQNLNTLIAKWRNPSLTIHKVKVSGPNNDTVIPQLATASISVRIVPNQNLETIKGLLLDKLKNDFEEFKSPNKLLIDIFHEGEPWLGDTTNLIYQILYEKLKLHWGPGTPEPLFIREGGTIPSIRFLEKCFNAPAAQIPCGQASDNAHLKNEKLRLINLFKLRSILFDTLKDLGDTE